MFSYRYRQVFPPLISSWRETQASNLRCTSLVPCMLPTQPNTAYCIFRIAGYVNNLCILQYSFSRYPQDANRHRISAKKKHKQRTMQLEISAHNDHSRTSKKIPLETKPYEKRNESISFAQAPTVTNSLRFCLYFVNFTQPHPR
jgi:hypothetical protein